MYSKGLVFAVIILFIGVAFSPSFYAESLEPLNPEITPVNNKNVGFEVIEFKPDGTIEKTIVKLKLEEAKEFGKKLKDIKTAEGKLSIFKEYGFIPEEVTLETLKLGMEEQAKRIDLTGEKLKQFVEYRASFFKSNYVKINIKCYVQGENFFPLRLIIGLSSITRAINAFLLPFFSPHIFIPSVDLLNTQFGLFNGISAKDGLLNDIFYKYFFGSYAMLGFVGYYVNVFPFPLIIIPLIPILTFLDWWFGYSAFVILSGGEVHLYPE